MFADRTEAGIMLAERLAQEAPRNAVVLALPRGGLPVALPVAQRLGAQLDLLFVRKIGVPGHEELAAGAVVNGDGYRTVFNTKVLQVIGRTELDFANAVASKVAEIAERRKRYLGDRPTIDVADRDVVLVDDGIATGATVKAGLSGLRARAPASVTLAVPVAPADTLADLAPLVDRIVCLERPEPFYAVGMHYVRFEQVSDAEVAAMMASAPGAGETGDTT